MAANDSSFTADSILQEEIEVLESIYIDELQVDKDERDHVMSVTLQLHPSTGDDLDKKYVCMTLTLNLPTTYPYDLPEVIIRNPRGVGEEELESLHEAINELAEDRRGGHMLYDIIELAKESLTEGNVPHCPCAICLDHFHEDEEFTRTECYHYFHCHCLGRYVTHTLETIDQEIKDLPKHKQHEQDSIQKMPCPVCRENITYDPDYLSSCHTPEPENTHYQIDDSVRKWQVEMAAILESQKQKGGVIDLEAEKNKFLVTADDVIELPRQGSSGELDRSEKSATESKDSRHRNNKTSAFQGGGARSVSHGSDKFDRRNERESWRNDRYRRKEGQDRWRNDRGKFRYERENRTGDREMKKIERDQDKKERIKERDEQDQVRDNTDKKRDEQDYKRDDRDGISRRNDRENTNDTTDNARDYGERNENDQNKRKEDRGQKESYNYYNGKKDFNPRPGNRERNRHYRGRGNYDRDGERRSANGQKRGGHVSSNAINDDKCQKKSDDKEEENNSLSDQTQKEDRSGSSERSETSQQKGETDLNSKSRMSAKETSYKVSSCESVERPNRGCADTGKESDVLTNIHIGVSENNQESRIDRKIEENLETKNPRGSDTLSEPRNNHSRKSPRSFYGKYSGAKDRQHWSGKEKNDCDMDGVSNRDGSGRHGRGQGKGRGSRRSANQETTVNKQIDKSSSDLAENCDTENASNGEKRAPQSYTGFNRGGRGPRKREKQHYDSYSRHIRKPKDEKPIANSVKENSAVTDVDRPHGKQQNGGKGQRGDNSNSQNTDGKIGDNAYVESKKDFSVKNKPLSKPPGFELKPPPPPGFTPIGNIKNNVKVPPGFEQINNS